MADFTKERFQKLAGLLKEAVHVPTPDEVGMGEPDRYDSDSNVTSLGDYREKKERAGYSRQMLVSPDGKMVTDPEEWKLIIMDHEDQEDAIVDGDIVKAAELGAQFFNVGPGQEQFDPSSSSSSSDE